jgi:hypothetical protein
MKTWLRTSLIVLTLFIGIGAIGGFIMMRVDPSGEGWGGAPMLDLLRAKMPWPELFFRDFIPSGYVLLAVNGLPQILAALLLIKRRRIAPWVVLACGIILMLWIVLEWWVWGFNAISNLYFVFGLLEAVAAVYWLRNNKQ